MNARRTTVVAEPGWQVGLVWAGFPVLGAALLWGVQAIADWVVSLPWAPLRGPFRLIASIPEPQATLGALGLGVLAGLVIAFIAEQERLSVEVADEALVFSRGGAEYALDRTQVSGVFLDGKKLVVLGLDTEELARENSDLHDTDLADAFQRHGYPWLPGDPYRDEYRRWVEDMPGLPPGANALLRARAKALKKDDTEDVKQLRVELARLGVVVREDRKRQFWRVSKQE
ncbi:YqeB family protein [Actinosynnema sp. CS-041913]|uniref:YqeB family protein n=1 Tax=Actinosynnema sp. CS-041913 TaxID=3239917 RepID=UPI003D92BCC1